MDKILFYYNSDVAEQIFWQNNHYKSTQSECENNFSIQPKVETELNIFPQKIYPKVTTDIANKNTQKQIISDKRYELQVINNLFESSVKVVIEQFPKTDNVIYHFSGNIILERNFIEDDGWNIAVLFSIGDYQLQGNTSPERWISSSLLKTFLLNKGISCNVLFKRLNRDENSKQPIQILAISEW